MKGVANTNLDLERQIQRTSKEFVCSFKTTQKEGSPKLFIPFSDVHVANKKQNPKHKNEAFANRIGGSNNSDEDMSDPKKCTSW